MTSGTPYIGSKISLISKAEIRYEGILYDVDSKEATVTLSKVKSFGTENRQAPKHIPPRNEVYEYIIFRGSDIKDLSVSEMGNKEEEDPHLDPAIVSAHSAPPPGPSTRPDPRPDPMHSQSSGTGSSILPTPSHPVPPGGAYTQFPPGLGGYNPFGMPYFGRPPMMMGQPLHHPMHHPQSNQTQQPHPPTPPTHISTITSGNQSMPMAHKTVQPPTASTTQSESTPPVATTVSTTKSYGASTPGFTTHQPVQPAPPPPVSKAPPTSQSTDIVHTPTVTANTPKVVAKQQQDITTGGGKHSPSSSLSSGNEENEGGGVSGRRQPRRGRRGDSQQKSFNYTPRGPRGNNWRGGRGSNPRPSRGGQGIPSNRPLLPQPKPEPQPLKYTKDFDFESANALFSKDQLAKEMSSKLKISDDQKVGVSEGDDPLPSAEQEELEEGEIETNGNSAADEDNDVEFYDRSKSFFDTISCENNQPNSNRRPNRSEEMALNTETFGVSRGGRPRDYQGRGYNNRYRGGGHGYYNQYNGYGNQYRGRYGNRGGYYGGRGRNNSRSGGYNDYQGRGNTGRDSNTRNT